MKTAILVALAAMAVGLVCGPAAAKEPDPVPFRGAPLIPWAKRVGENRFRSPRNYDGTVEYYHEIFRHNPHIEKKKIINTSTVRAVHYQHTRKGARWEGLNVYEHKGAAWIFVVFSDEELEKIEQEKKSGKHEGRRKRRKKRGRRKKKT